MKEPTMGIKTFRDLIAWQRAMELARQVYQITARLPEVERFGLTSQMRRAAISIPSNIAEGYARGMRADYLRFLRTSRGSLAELQTQLLLAEQLGMLAVDPRTNDLLAESDRILQGLIRSLEPKKA